MQVATTASIGQWCQARLRSRRMRAAVYHGGGRLTVEDVPVPAIRDGELLVRMRACGLCGSDLMTWYQDRKAPVVIGHEPVGEVVEVGPGAPFTAGQRVFVHHHVPCFECRLCRAGRHTLCETFRTTRIDPGGLAELIRVPRLNVEADVLAIPDDLDDVAATLTEPVACIVRGQRMAGVTAGSRVAVVGAGSMGLLEIQVAKALGAAEVVALEPRADRRAIAGRVGAITPDGTGADAVRDALDGELADQVFVCTHHHGAIAESLHMAGPAGVVQLFAPTEPGELVPLDLGAVFFREVTLQSTYSAGPADTREALGMLAAGLIDPRSVISHRVSLEEAGEAYRLAASGEAMKVVVEGPEPRT
jgi:L-iditol 2-dehydrogenase